jgi:acetylornithine deacetylase/succinyl-diaminopimelate desuccinylase-like protein
LRWHRREAALRNVIARWREPAIMRRVLPDSARDRLREQCAAEIEAALKLDCEFDIVRGLFLPIPSKSSEACKLRLQ